MLNVFNAILDFLQMGGDFILNIITGIASLMELIPKALHMQSVAVGYMPPMLSVFALAGISVCVVFHILGR